MKPVQQTPRYIYPLDICACGHNLQEHYDVIIGGCVCGDNHKFCIDNLSYVEELAKKRNLI